MDRRVLFVSLVLGFAVVLGTGTALFAFVGGDGPTAEPTVLWETDPASEYGDNHHNHAAIASGDAGDGARYVALPVSDFDDADTCGLRVYDEDGEEAWSFHMSDEECNPHAIGDVTAGTIDGQPVFAVGTSEPMLRVFDAATGEERFAYELDSMGYAAPAIADVTGDGAEEVVVGGFSGDLHLIDATGEAVWTRSLDGRLPLGPLVGDLREEGLTTIAVSTTGSGGETALLDADGEVVWTDDYEETPTAWSLAETRRGTVLALAGGQGTLTTLEAADGTTRYDARLQNATIRTGGTDAGRIAVGGQGAVWNVDLLDGEVVWKQQFGNDVHVSPPMTGDVTGDGTPETVAVTRDGAVVAMNRRGEVVARGGVDATVHVAPLLVDLNGDGSLEAVLLTGDGRAIALTF